MCRHLGGLVSAGGSAEDVPAVGGRLGPQPCQSRAGGERLEATGLAAGADDVTSDGHVADLPGHAVDAAHDLTGVDDRGGETGAEVQIGKGAIGAQAAQVVRAERGRLDVVLHRHGHAQCVPSA